MIIFNQLGNKNQRISGKNFIGNRQTKKIMPQINRLRIIILNQLGNKNQRISGKNSIGNRQTKKKLSLRLTD